MATTDPSVSDGPDRIDSQVPFSFPATWNDDMTAVIDATEEPLYEEDWRTVTLTEYGDRDVQWRADRYEKSSRSTWDTAQDAVLAFWTTQFKPSRMVPAHGHAGERDEPALQFAPTKNLRCIQYPDGSGEIRARERSHGSFRLRVIRTRTGLRVLNGASTGGNIATGGRGYTAWRVTLIDADGIDAVLPLNAIMAYLEDRDGFEPTDIFHIDRCSDKQGSIYSGSRQRRQRGSYRDRYEAFQFQYPEQMMAHLPGGRKLAFFRDASGSSGDEFCIRSLTREEASDMHTIADVLDWLKPDLVRESDRSVVPATGSTQFNDDIIARQGDFYFIPKDAGWRPYTDVYIADENERPSLVTVNQSSYRTTVDETLAEFAWYSGKKRPDPTTLTDDEELVLAAKDDDGHLREIDLREGHEHPALDTLGNHVPTEVATVQASADGGDDADTVEEIVVRGDISHDDNDHDTFSTDDRWARAVQSPDEHVGTLSQRGQRRGSAGYD